MFAGSKIGAEQERVAGLEVRAEAAKDRFGLGGREVADAGADVECEDAVASTLLEAGGALERVGLGDVVGELRLDGEAGNGRGEGCGGLSKRGGADVDGLVEDLGLEARCGVPVLEALPAPSSAMVTAAPAGKDRSPEARGERNSRKMSSAWAAKRARSVRVR